MEKGFNLFTALLAIILILVTSMLVMRMVQEERSTRVSIEEMAMQERLDSVMRLMRADVLQVFNYETRETIEVWLSHPDNYIDFGDLKVWSDWDALQKEFIHGYFGSREADEGQLAHSMSRSLSGIIRRYREGLTYEARYEVRVVGEEDEFREIMIELIRDSSEAEDFIEVIDCDGTPEGCEAGSFYINLRISEMDDEVYESLPRIVVRDRVTGNETRGAILPRHDVKMYVPVRVFKAFAVTRKFLHTDLDSINSASDWGYLSPRIHNEIDSMALGVCDYGYCNPRENPYFPPATKGFDDKGKACPGAPTNRLENVPGIFREETFTYNPSSPDSMRGELERLVKKRLCEVSVENFSGLSSPEFTIREENFDGKNCYLRFSRVNATSVPSIKIEEVNDPGTVVSVGDHQEPNNPDGCPFSFELAQNRRIGFFRPLGGEVSWPDLGSETCNSIHFETMACYGLQSCCTQLSEATFRITFEENDLNYRVRESRDAKITIGITDRTFTPFNPNYDIGQPVPGLGCVLQGSLQEINCNADGWTCKTVWDDYQHENCYPLSP